MLTLAAHNSESGDPEVYYSVCIDGVLLDYYTTIEAACWAIEILSISLKEAA